MSEPKATIYESRRECLIAFATREPDDKRRVFTATKTGRREGDDEWLWWGIATTEQAFRKALSHYWWRVSRLTRDDMQRAMAEELTAPNES